MIFIFDEIFCSAEKFRFKVLYFYLKNLPAGKTFGDFIRTYYELFYAVLRLIYIRNTDVPADVLRKNFFVLPERKEK